jgi:uncharacterized membrane protein YfcA
LELPLAIAIVLLAALAALIQALSGFGFSLFIVPILAILIGPQDTVLLANLLSTFSNAMQARNLRHAADRRTAIVLTVASCAGMPVGLAVLLLVEARALQVAIAVMVIVSTLVLMRGVALHAAGTLGDVAAGFTSGVLNTSTSLSGPPIVLYLQGKGLAPLQFRATIATFFLVTSAIAVTLMIAAGAFRPYILGAWAISVPAVFAGQRLGNVLFERVDLLLFRRMVFGILFVSAGIAIVGALVG